MFSLRRLCSPPAEAAFVLAASYGLRRSECAGLRWSAIDFRARRMVINHTAILSNGRILYVDNVKTRSSYRTLPLSDSLRRYLTDLRRRQKENRRKYGKAYHQSDYVCVREDGTPLRPDYISASSGASAAAPVCRASGFTICGIRSRRSCSSRAFPSSRFRNGSVIRISPRPQTFTRTCRMWRRSLSPRARFRSSKSESCKIIPAFQSARFSEKIRKSQRFFLNCGFNREIDYFACNLKKILALVLAFACAFTMFAGAAFTDQADIKVENEVVDTLIELGVINGYTDGSFKPNDTVTRAEMAKMIYVLRTGNSDASAYNNDKTSFY